MDGISKELHFLNSSSIINIQKKNQELGNYLFTINQNLQLKTLKIFIHLFFSFLFTLSVRTKYFTSYTYKLDYFFKITL